MKTRVILFLLSATVLSAWSTGCTVDTNETTDTVENKRPNILIAISDDQGHIHAGPYGFAPVRTPTLDHLAEQGILFNNNFTGVTNKHEF